ncbi:hypothetical protein M513_04485, partial [Trichuris suis]
MERALAASAVAKHAAHCSGSLQSRVLCREPHLSIRRIKEALYIQHNENINRDKGVEISNIWNNVINVTNYSFFVFIAPYQPSTKWKGSNFRNIKKCVWCRRYKKNYKKLLQKNLRCEEADNEERKIPTMHRIRENPGENEDAERRYDKTQEKMRSQRE